MSISAGTCTIGAGGDAPNYLTWAAFKADLAATLTGDLTATQVADTTETDPSAFTTALAGYTLRLTSDTNPLGNFTAGRISTYTSSTAGALKFTCTSASSGAKIILNNLNYKMGGTGVTVYTFLSNTTNITHQVYDCLVNGGGRRLIGLQANAANCVVQVYNYVAANSTSASAAAHTVGLLLSSCHSSSIIENCSFHNFTQTSTGYGVGLWNYINSTCVIKNIASFSNEKDYAYGTGATGGLGSATASKCASSDATGSEVALQSLVAADEFESLDIASADFLKLKSTATMKNIGTTPSIGANTYGIRGGVRPHEE